MGRLSRPGDSRVVVRVEQSRAAATVKCTYMAGTLGRRCPPTPRHTFPAKVLAPGAGVRHAARTSPAVIHKNLKFFTH